MLLLPLLIGHYYFYHCYDDCYDYYCHRNQCRYYLFCYFDRLYHYQTTITIVCFYCFRTITNTITITIVINGCTRISASDTMTFDGAFAIYSYCYCRDFDVDYALHYDSCP